MQVYVDSSCIGLDKRHYIGQGGEGAVYARDSTAYKIYANPHKMIPVGKISELAAISDKRIIRPLKIISNKKGRPIGYTMTYVKAAYTLCQLFPRSFRDREGLNVKAVIHLVREMQEGISNIHGAGVLIVDLNEMNFLVTRDFGSLFFIDADSYQTKGFRATALMESIRDRHMLDPLDFCKLTDWFAFSIVSFQMFCGIHPYKGKHKVLKGLDARMRANVSVLHKGVRVPRAAYPVDVIPQVYRDWYKAVFEEGKRVPPPIDFGGTVTDIIGVVPAAADLRVIKGTKVLDITEVLSSQGEPIRNFWAYEQSFTMATDTTILLNGHVVPGTWKEPMAVAYSPVRGKAVVVCRQRREGEAVGAEKIRLYNLSDRNEIPFTFTPDDLMTYEGRVYMKRRGNVYELILTDTGSQVIATSCLACTVMEKATKLFPGVTVQNLLGLTYLVVFPSSGMNYQIVIKELDDYKIVDAKYDRNVLMTVGMKNGKYDRIIFRFDTDHRTYDIRVVEDITPSGLNFVVLDSKVAVCLNEEERLEVFRADEKGSTKLTYVDDPVLGGDMTLVRKEGKLAFYRGDTIYSMSLRKK